ncbi:uroporphyrinogen-III C-methyltransferase [Mucilaginibacter sp. UC70_90]
MTNRNKNIKEPRITLVGAGPGDADLITVKAIKALKTADVVLYDALVNEELLEYAPETSTKVYVGKRSGDHTFSQEAINNLMVDYAKNYGHVVRLKGGDPFVFGRGYEELIIAAAHKIPASVIPGISSSIAVPELQQIPVTHRGLSESFWVVTGTTANGKISNDLIDASRSNATVVVLMGIHKLAEIAEIFKLQGRNKLPVAVIQSGSTDDEKIAVATVDTIVNAVEESKISSPAIIVLGEVVSLHPKFQLIQEVYDVVARDRSLTNIQDMKQEGNQLFPVFLKLNDLHTVLIGGGNVGLEKLTAVLNNSNSARVTVISREFLPEVHTLASQYPGIRIIQKSFTDDDLNDADIVIAATNDSELNSYVRNAAHDRKLLINVADKPALCDFYLGSIVQKGDLKLAISTNGKSPTVAKRLKEVLNESLPAELDITLQQMSELRNTLEGDFADKVKKLNSVTSVLVEPKPVNRKNFIWLIWSTIIISLAIGITALYFKEPNFKHFVTGIDPIFYYFLGAGFVFAMIDGAIGMSYGVTSTTFSLSMGIPPASASMGVHLSEIMSCGIAGWMHYRMGNINWKLFKLLVIPGIIGAVTGAYLLSSLEHYSMYTKPVVSVYTLILGIVIFRKAFNTQKKKSADKVKRISLLGLGGGFIDAVGGGGWGSIVLSTLIAGGRSPRFSLGTVKLSRFFVAMMGSITFIAMVSSDHWQAVGGLILGSALASPIAAKISNKISAKTIMVAVSVIVILISIRSIIMFITKVI